MELTLDILYIASRFVSKNAAPVVYYFEFQLLINSWPFPKGNNKDCEKKTRKYPIHGKLTSNKSLNYRA